MKRENMIFIIALVFCCCSLVLCLVGIEVERVAIPQGKYRNERIANGSISEINQRPYQAALFLEYEDDLGFCGGVLISASLVLTAGHCHYNLEDGQVVKYTILLGAQNIYDSNEFGTRRMVSTTVIPHPGYDPETTMHNLAIIVLPKAIEFTERIMPVTLPSEQQWNSNHVSAQATISGWGINNEKLQLSPYLKRATMLVWLNSVCNPHFGNLITDDMLCTNGFPGVSTCQGDSGGPLTVSHFGEDILIGIASFTTILGCGGGYPSVFTRIGRHMPWIMEVIEANTL